MSQLEKLERSITEDTKKFIEQMNSCQSLKFADSDNSTTQSSPDKDSNHEVELMLKKKFVEIQSKSNVFRNFTEKDMFNLKSSIQMLEAMSSKSGSFTLEKDK